MLNVTQAITWSGGLPELAESDNQYLEVRRGSGPIEIEMKGTSPVESPKQISITVESRHGLFANFRRPNFVTRQVELFNYDSGQFEVVDTGESSLFDQTFVIDIDVAPERFIESGTGCVEIRICFLVAGFPKGRQIFIDHFDWKVVN